MPSPRLSRGVAWLSVAINICDQHLDFLDTCRHRTRLPLSTSFVPLSGGGFIRHAPNAWFGLGGTHTIYYLIKKVHNLSDLLYPSDRCIGPCNE